MVLIVQEGLGQKAAEIEYGAGIIGDERLSLEKSCQVPGSLARVQEIGQHGHCIENTLHRAQKAEVLQEGEQRDEGDSRWLHQTEKQHP